MAKNSFSSGNRGSEVVNKKELSTEMDGIETGTTKPYRPIFVLLPGLGINIKEGKSTTCNVIRMFYLFILLVISVWLSGCQLYPILSNELTREGSWYVSYTDQYVVVAIVYVAAFKNRCIGQLFKDTWSIYNEASDISGANRRLKRWQWAFALLALINIMGLVCIVMDIALTTDDQFDQSAFRKEYFGIETKNVIVIRSVTFVTYFTLQFCAIIVSVFGCFVIVQCFLIRESFNGLHVTLKANGNGYLCDYLIKHRQLSGIVNRFNETFHPAILVLVCILMTQMVTIAEDTSMMIQKDDWPYLTIALYVLYLAQSTMIFIIFVYFGNEIQSEARNGIEILLEAYISVTSSTNEEIVDNKNGQMISLFIAQLDTAPVAISASGVFDINVNLITIVTSIAITYHTFVSSLKSDKFNKAIVPTMAPYNLSISSLQDNSSVAP